MEQTVLIVDDEESIRDMVQTALELDGYRCLQAANAREGHAAILDEGPDLVLLDWMMPETSGIELLRRLRKDGMTANLPIILLTAKTDEAQKVHGLEVGADDYITKPFSTRELSARIKAILRRSGVQIDESMVEIKPLKLDPVAQRIVMGDTPLPLGPTEYRLLYFFMTHQERAYSRSQLLDHVWGSNVYVDERTVDVHIRRLRKVLDEASEGAESYGSLIQTVRGTGYRFSIR